MITIDEIKFDSRSPDARRSIVNVRQNAIRFLGKPRWRRTECVNPEDSRVVYALKSARSKKLTIEASFTSAFDGAGRAEVRVQHHVKARHIRFKNGKSGFIRFELINPLTRYGRIGVWDTEWKWEYRNKHHRGWRLIGRSCHRIYVLLNLPKAPWRQYPFTSNNTQLLWTDVLDYACRWAAGARTVRHAASLITRNVYALGPTTFTYDCRGGGNSNYSYPDFDCTALLERLRGDIGNGQYVNCSDCAAMVSTFANALGCDLWQSKMGWNFALNRLLAIGGSRWQTPCGWYWFQYHEVAWKNPCTATDGLFDACLQVDGNDNPGRPPLPSLPCGVRFDRYVYRLASPIGRPNCIPRPQTKQRRRVV